MINLVKSAKAWNSRNFEDVLKNEVKALGLEHLPLQQGLSSSSVALDHNLQLTVLRTNEKSNLIIAKMGAFYSGIIGGCSWADNPTPMEEANEYCELEVTINLDNGDASVTLAESSD